MFCHTTDPSILWQGRARAKARARLGSSLKHNTWSSLGIAVHYSPLTTTMKYKMCRLSFLEWVVQTALWPQLHSVVVLTFRLPVLHCLPTPACSLLSSHRFPSPELPTATYPLYKKLGIVQQFIMLREHLIQNISVVFSLRAWFLTHDGYIFWCVVNVYMFDMGTCLPWLDDRFFNTSYLTGKLNSCHWPCDKRCCFFV